MEQERKYVLLVDQTKRLVAAVRLVETSGDRAEGIIIFSNFSAEMQEAFHRYENIVNTQQFAFLDEAEAAIQAFGISAWFLPDERAAEIDDLQIMNKMDVTFRIQS